MATRETTVGNIEAARTEVLHIFDEMLYEAKLHGPDLDNDPEQARVSIGEVFLNVMERINDL